MHNCDDFLELAKCLVGVDPPNANVRAAISRAYYWTYHCVIEVLEQHKQFPQIEGPEAHKAVIEYLRARDPLAGSKLARLRHHRNLADYRCDVDVELDMGRDAIYTAKVVEAMVYVL